MAHPWRRLAWSAVSRAVGLSILGFIGWAWFASADDSAWKAASSSRPWPWPRSSAARGACVTPATARRWRLRWITTPSKKKRRGLSHGGTLKLVLSRRFPPPTPGNGQIRCGLTTELPLMSDNHPTTREQDARRESFAAEPTGAADPLVLRRGLEGLVDPGGTQDGIATDGAADDGPGGPAGRGPGGLRGPGSARRSAGRRRWAGRRWARWAPDGRAADGRDDGAPRFGPRRWAGGRAAADRPAASLAPRA